MRLFRQFPGEVPRIYLPRTWVNKGKKKGRSLEGPQPSLAMRCLRRSLRSLAPVLLSRCEPSRGCGAELLYSARLVFRYVLRCEGLSPTAVHPFVDEDLGAGIPEGTSEWNALGSVLLHPRERAVLEDLSPLPFVDRDVEELSDAAHLSRHVALEVREVHEQDVREVPELPPGADALPEGPEGMSVAVHPIAEVLPDVAGRWLDGRTYAPWGVVECLVPEVV